MQSNFYLKKSKRNKHLLIHLHGIFDGASAFELLKVIRQGEKEGLPMIVNTDRLKDAMPFGQAVLDSHLPRTALRKRVYFRGVWAEGILPEGCRLLADKAHTCKGDCENCTCLMTGIKA